MTRRCVAAVVVYLLALALSGLWLVRNLSVTTDLSAFLPQASTPLQSLLVRQLRDGVASRLILIGIGGPQGTDGAGLAQASREVARVLQADPQFAFVANGDPSTLGNEQALVTRWRYVLSPAVVPGHFTADALRASLEDAMRLLASPMGPLVQRTLPRDPSGELPRLAELLVPAEGPRREDGVWVSPQGDRALLLAQTHAPGFDLDAQDRAAQAVRDAVGKAASQAGSSIRPALAMSSPGLLGATSRRIIEADARRASLLALAGVALLLVATYRSAWPVALSALPALSGLLAGVTAVSVLFGPVHAITIGFGAMLVGEAVDYPTYLFANRIGNEPLEATRKRIGRTLVLAVLTTACGALAMLLSGFRGLVQLGVLIVAGVLAAGTVALCVLPCLAAAPRWRSAVSLPGGALVRVAAALRKARLGVLLAVVAAGVALFAMRGELWNDDLSSLSPLDAAALERDRDLRTSLKAPDVRYLAAVGAADREGALQASELVAAALDGAVARGAIAAFDAPSRYLPSEQVQQARLAALPDAATLRRNLEVALEPLPFRPDAFEPFIRDMADAARQGVLRRADLEGTAFALKVDSLLLEDQGRWWALLPLTGMTDMHATRTAVAGSGATLLDLKGEADGLVARYRERAMLTSLLGFAAIAGIVWVGTRSFRETSIRVAPVAAAVVLTAGLLVMAGERLTLFHLVALLLVAGVGINYALFFGQPSADPAERAAALRSILVAGLATLCASLALAFTQTAVLRAIGLTTLVGTLAAFACAAAFSGDNERMTRHPRY